MLMQMNNRCAVKIREQYYWLVEFSVPNSTATSILAFSRQQLDRMRNVLIQNGRIMYKKGKGSQCGKYRMIPFDAHYVTQSVTQIDTQSVTQPDTQVWQLCNNMSTLININNNTKSNFINGVDDYKNIYQRAHAREDEQLGEEIALFAIGIFKKYWNKAPTESDIELVRQKVIAVDMGDGEAKAVMAETKKELLEYAFEQSTMAGCLNWRYVQGIYINLQQRGIRSRDDAEAFQAEIDLAQGKI